MRRVLVPRVPPPGERVTVDAAESHHLLDVIRVARGERVAVVDGRGARGVGRLAAVTDDRAVIEIEEVERGVPAEARVVLLGVPRAALLEEALILGTETGATAFVLVRARFSPPGEPRRDRLERILRTAVTQCGRADLPVLHDPVPLASALDGLPPGSRWMCAGGAPTLHRAGDGAACVAVGPEGGWAVDERALLERAGFVAAGLGPHTLRTPTAVAVALGRLSRS